MLQGICPKCGITYLGWALNEGRICYDCGTDLKITEMCGGITGTCPKCGKNYIGWAFREYRVCYDCGTDLEITEIGGRTTRDSSLSNLDDVDKLNDLK